MASLSCFLSDATSSACAAGCLDCFWSDAESAADLAGTIAELGSGSGSGGEALIASAALAAGVSRLGAFFAGFATTGAAIVGFTTRSALNSSAIEMCPSPFRSSLATSASRNRFSFSVTSGTSSSNMERSSRFSRTPLLSLSNRWNTAETVDFAASIRSLSRLMTSSTSADSRSATSTPMLMQFFIDSTSSMYVTLPSLFVSHMAEKYRCCAAVTPGITASRNLPSSSESRCSFWSLSNLSKASFK